MQNMSPADRIDLAFEAAEFRTKLDALLAEHNARIGIGWYGKWTVLQILFPTKTMDEAVTLIKAGKGKGMRYVTEQEELCGWPEPHAVQLFDDIVTALNELGDTPLIKTRYRTCKELAASVDSHLREIKGGNL